jgi:ADP-heptose:LPS heptosyltransferase
MNLRLKQIIDVYIGKAILLANLIAVRGTGLLLRRNHNLINEPEHILVIKILGLGSVIMASDSIYSLKRKYPKAKLILLCGNGVKAGIEPLGLFDEIWTINDKSFGKLVRSGLSALWKSWRLKKRWIVDLEIYSVLTTIFSSWTCAINRFGFQLDKTNFRNYLNTHNVYFNQFIKVGINYHNLAAAIGVTEFYKFTFPAEFTRNEYRKDTVVINNTCSELGGSLRKLPDFLLAGVCREILSSTSYKIAFVGAPSDRGEVEQFILKHQLEHSRVINAAGKYDFPEYYTFLGSEAKCMISIDSAPLHIAQKLNVPALSFWGPINPVQRLEDISNTYYLNKTCSPCIHHTEVIPCGGNNTCMKDMRLEDIIYMLNRVM